MVKKGLKVGDRFEDGGRTYIVQEVLPNGNYISKMYVKIEGPAEEPNAAEKKNGTAKK